MEPGKEKKKKIFGVPYNKVQWKPPQLDINRIIWQEMKASGKRRPTELKTKQ